MLDDLWGRILLLTYQRADALALAINMAGDDRSRLNAIDTLMRRHELERQPVAGSA